MSLSQAIDWFQCVTCQKETTENPQRPVNWKRHYSCIEQDLTSFYEAGKLDLAVDCRGNVLTSRLLCGKISS